MPRPFPCALTCAILAATAIPAAPIPQHLMKSPVYYFPTKIGAKLEYEEPGRELTMVVTSVADRAGAKVVSVGRLQPNETVTPFMTMAVTGTGLYRTERCGRKFDVPEIWLKLPAEQDKPWEYPTGDLTLSPRALVWNAVGGAEDVTVPAGTFHCVRVHSRQNGRDATYWFAPDVGLVKTEAATWSEVLKSYTPGRD